MAGKTLVKLLPLENRLLKLSYESYFIRVGPETREWWLIESDPATALIRKNVKALNQMDSSPPRTQCTTT